MSLSKIHSVPVVQFIRLTSLAAFGSLFAAACGGNIIPIGGEPVDTTDTDTTTSEPTRPDDSDTNTSDGPGDDSDTRTDESDDTGGGTNPSEPDTPPGVQCALYPVCDVNTGCEAGNECMALPECETAICIPTDEVCRLSCPVVEECMILESYPAQLRCDGRVPAIPGHSGRPDECTTEGGRCLPDGETAPPTYVLGDFDCEESDYQCWVPLSSEPSVPSSGVSCDNYRTCDAETSCAAGQSCIAFPEIDTALCIDWQEACELSCPDPSACTIAESHPAQLSCPGRLDATCSVGGGTNGDAGVPQGVACEEHETCDALDPCDEGSCVKVPGCEVPLCIDSQLACSQSCGTADCQIAESYPLQLFCDSDADAGSNPDEPVASNDAGTVPVECAWTPDELLEQVMLDGTYALDCGERHYGDEVDLAAAMSCVLGAEGDAGAKFVHNQCPDCLRRYTYLHLSGGELVVLFNSTVSGETYRRASVTRCESLTSEAECVGPETLYDCEDEAGSAMFF